MVETRKEIGAKLRLTGRLHGRRYKKLISLRRLKAPAASARRMPPTSSLSGFSFPIFAFHFNERITKSALLFDLHFASPVCASGV